MQKGVQQRIWQAGVVKCLIIFDHDFNYSWVCVFVLNSIILEVVFSANFPLPEPNNLSALRFIGIYSAYFTYSLPSA